MGDALLDDLQRAVDRRTPDLAWHTGTEGGVFEHDGNGYGGETLHSTYNSAARSTTEVPDDWPSLTAALDAELATQGFGPAPRRSTALRVRRRRTPTDRALGARIASRDRMTA